MTKHTPTPWDVSGTIITGKDPIGSRGDYNIGPIASMTHSWRNRATDLANAAHIVKCVNLHGEFKALLQHALHYIETPGDFTDAERMQLCQEIEDTLAKAE